ncbi:MAG: cation:proton antiporter [Chloroflexi bacterium]|nr:cation:proton antiporter [Chloroflexota bacterium]MCL5275390.1 cation:proton antiporter [Chloroflexota bacterium]
MSVALQLILQLAILILAAKAAGLVSVRLKQPAVLGELLAGLVLGPTLLDIFHWPLFTAPQTTEEIVFELAELGVILLMFMAGLEVDVREMLHTGRTAVIAGVLGVIAPLILGGLASLLFNYPVSSSVFIGLILTATSVSISAQTLLELGVIKSREGLALLGAAVVDDVLVILVLSIFLATIGSSGAGAIAGVIVRMALFFVIAVPVGLWLLPRLTYRIERLPISEGVVSWAIVATLLFAFAAEALGQIAAITGAFLAGIFFGRTRLRHEIMTGMHTIAYAFFVPLFLVSIGLKVDARSLNGAAVIFMLAITLIAILSKVAGAGLGAKLAGMRWSESLRVGVGMISRGEVGLIVASIGLQQGLIDDSMFVSMVMMILLTTLLTPFLLRRVFPHKTSATAKEIAHGDKLADVSD